MGNDRMDVMGEWVGGPGSWIEVRRSSARGPTASRVNRSTGDSGRQTSEGQLTRRPALLGCGRYGGWMDRRGAGLRDSPALRMDGMNGA
jgi:hypothetical protein